MNTLAFFIALQIADVISTILCFQIGLTETSPATAFFIAHLGVIMGLLAGKLCVCGLAYVLLEYRKKLRATLWIANAAYVLVVLWNLFLFSVIGFANHVTHYRP